MRNACGCVCVCVCAAVREYAGTTFVSYFGDSVL